MHLTRELATDYSIHTNKGLRYMLRKEWQALRPWKPFFWYSRLPIGVYLRSERRPALFPSGRLVDEEIYFAVRLIPDVQKAVLSLHRYAFRIDPGTHTKHSVHRKGYWHFDASIASLPSESLNLLKDLMQSLEILAFDRDAIRNPLDISLDSLVAWEERMTLAPHTRWRF